MNMVDIKEYKKELMTDRKALPGVDLQEEILKINLLNIDDLEESDYVIDEVNKMYHEGDFSQDVTVWYNLSIVLEGKAKELAIIVLNSIVKSDRKFENYKTNVDDMVRG